MSTWRNLTFMRRRQMRLMAEEQQRQARHLQHQQVLALADMWEGALQAEFGDAPATTPGPNPPQPAAALSTTEQAIADSVALDGQAHLLRRHLH